MTMEKKQLAEILNNRQYTDEITPELERIAKESGLVVVFGGSDDNCEFRGAISEEIPCWEGERIFFNKDGSNFTNENGECFLTYHKDKDEPEPNMVEAVWCGKRKIFDKSGNYYSWTYQTEIPHETFDILEDEDIFCRGIVFSVNDLT